MGEPLNAEEIKELVNGCLKSQRQLNMDINLIIYYFLFEYFPFIEFHERIYMYLHVSMYVNHVSYKILSNWL